MKIQGKNVFIIICSIILFAVGLFLIKLSFLGYAILCFTLTVILMLVGIVSIINGSNPNRLYDSKVREILNTFDSILVQSNSVPSLEGRNIVMLESMDDLVDAQLEIRKPICYQKQSESCCFILLDDKEAYIYIEKLNSDIISPVEIELNELKVKNKNAEEMDSEMLREIDKTTIVKLSNKKSYKVSPVRKKKSVVEEEIEIL